MESRCPVGGESAQGDELRSRRFDSWKEIGAYFGRDVRTVRRWEQLEGLPVHRHRHRARGSVYAFQHELDDWHVRRSVSGRVPPPSPRFPVKGFLLAAGVLSLLGLAGWVSALNPGGFRARPGGTEPVVGAGPATDGGTRWLADPEVRQRMLLARHHLDRRVGFRKEIRQYLTEVIERAPDFAEAHALLGEVYLRQALHEPAGRAESWRKATSAVTRALALDENLAVAHAVSSRILLLRDWNWAAAASESRRAIELDSNAPVTRSAYALYLRSAGRLAEAIVEHERAQRADPLNPQQLIFLGDDYLFARRYVDAINAYERALQLERDYRPAVASLADVCARAGRYADAAAWQRRLLTLRGLEETAAAFEDIRGRDGPRAALEWLDRWNLGELQRDPEAHLWDLAYTHARLGNRQSALEFLERAYARREPGLLQARIDPDLDPLRDDRRFTDLLRRIGPP